LIEWTGERLVPWAPDVQVVYEHFHRYLWAQPLVAGRRVLDLASGEGFGSALLADRAGAVVGVDIDPVAIEHARANYAAPNLAFVVASADDLSAFRDSSFGAVVAFEMIEHVPDQAAVLREVVRVLAPGGLLIVSTPERRTYSDATGHVNPFHEHELTLEEFSALLESRFETVALFVQRAITGSRIEALEPSPHAPHHAVRLEREGDEWREAGPPEPLYIVAVASNAELPPLPAGSSLSDYGLALVDEAREQERAVRDEREAELLAERERLIAEVTERTREREEAHARAQRAEDEARRVTESASWRALERARAVLARVPLLERALQRAAQLAFKGSRRSVAPRD
jgi:SAM-dependent methyltransferase